MRSPKSPEERTEAAAYIATLSAELAVIARKNGMSTLGYLQDMAKLEAEQVVRLNGGQGH